MLEHKHLLVQGTFDTKLNKKILKDFLFELIESINMNILGGPYIHKSELEGNEGYTAILAITTSHIVIHTWDTGEFQLDVYSCKDFKVETVYGVLNNYKLIPTHKKFIDRSVGFEDLI